MKSLLHIMFISFYIQMHFHAVINYMGLMSSSCWFSGRDEAGETKGERGFSAAGEAGEGAAGTSSSRLGLRCWWSLSGCTVSFNISTARSIFPHIKIGLFLLVEPELHRVLWLGSKEPGGELGGIIEADFSVFFNTFYSRETKFD